MGTRADDCGSGWRLVGVATPGEDPRPLSCREVTPKGSWPARPGKHPEGASESSPGLASYLKHPQPPKMSSKNRRRERVRLKTTVHPMGCRARGQSGRREGHAEKGLGGHPEPRGLTSRRGRVLCSSGGALAWGDPRVSR